MALIASLGALCGVAAFAFVCTAFGCCLLRTARVEMQGTLEHLLCSVAAGVIAFETALALAEFFAPVRLSVFVLLAAVTAVGLSEWRALLRAISELVRGIIQGTRSELLLAAVVGCVALYQGLAAVAPLTGSDALHYHFAAPLHVLRSGFHPDFFLEHSFLTGQGHLLILAGLALGSEKLALALLWFGSVLAASATACLARKWASRLWALVAALAFLLNPVVFWQGTASGAPDLWMAVFVVAGILAISEALVVPSAALALFCGFLTGGIAGAKYTGIILAGALLVAFVLQTRTLSRIALFLTAALSAGVWPYLRNLIWTGDPVFPFGLRWLAPERINAFALESLRADTGASGHAGLPQLIEFPFFSAIDPAHLGFWQFFGPIVLGLAPLFLLWAKRSPLWRVTVITWLLGSLAVGASSGMLRFLLPLLPLGLVAAVAGAVELRVRQWRVAWFFACASIAVFLLLGFGGMVVYTRPAIAASVGLVDREAYLQQRSPDYAISAFVNRALAGKEREGYALVFFRHAYYLQVPYLNGDPQDSWAVDPSRLATPEAWHEFLRDNRVRWLVRAPDYPEEIAAPLEQLEQNGVAIPFVHGDVTTFEGLRILGVRRTFTATILRVND